MSAAKKIIAFLLLGNMTATLQAVDERIALSGHVPAQTQRAEKLDAVAGDEQISLSLVVQLDQTLLARTVDQIYASPTSEHRHFLAADDFAQIFHIADKRQILKDFAQANHLTVSPDEGKTNSLIVKVTGSAADIQKAFAIELNHYRGADGRVFRSNDTDPLSPPSLAPHLGAIVGLSNIANARRPHYGKAVRVDAKAQSSRGLTGGTGPGGTLAPSDIKTLYGLSGESLTGSGQTVALIEFDGYNPIDIQTYDTVFHLPATPLTFVGIDGTANLCGNQSCVTQNPNVDEGMIEVALDIELITALASGASQILVYDAPDTLQGSMDMLNKIATDDSAKVISTSWGASEADSGSAIVHAEDTIFMMMAAQGQTVFAAAGDCGAYDEQDNQGDCDTTKGFNVDDPGSQPYVTGVGGTSLSGTLQSFTETTWNTFGLVTPGATGGGVSTMWSLPSYQSGISGLASSQFRNVPDVAMNADPENSPYGIFVAGSFYAVGGTSTGSPLWAALTTLINQQRVSTGKTVLGFANPTFYQEGAGQANATYFNDVTVGNNVVPGAPTIPYQAGVGYDNVTGWGSFKGGALIETVGSITTPTTTLAALGSVYAYPNPWDIRNEGGQRVITFANVPSGATVKLFTLSGYWIKTLPAGSANSATWDLTNASGQNVASGLYIYDVSGGDQGSPVVGKVAIIK